MILTCQIDFVMKSLLSNLDIEQKNDDNDKTSKFLVSGGVAVAAATAFGVSVTAMDASEAVDEAK
eukprot:Awhi_evm1s4173